jgi:hypothetical protein
MQRSAGLRKVLPCSEPSLIFSQKRSYQKTKTKYFQNFYLLTIHRVTRIQPKIIADFSVKTAHRSNYRGSLFFTCPSLSSNVVIGDPELPVSTNYEHQLPNFIRRGGFSSL